MAARGRRRSGGFTLVELLVTVTVMAILLKVAVPSFAEAVLTSRLASYANEFVGSAQLARSEAVKRNAEVTLCASADGATCATSGSLAQGWIVTCNATTALPTICSAAGTVPLVLHKRGPLASDYHFTADSGATSFVFPASGVAASDSMLTLCRWNKPGDQERRITITAGGRVAVQTTRTGSCA